MGPRPGRGLAYSPGDGGLTFLVTDAMGEPVLLSDDTWKAQTYYIGPIEDTGCLDLTGVGRDSSGCGIPRSNDGTGYSAAHWAIPDDWTAPGFDDSEWPAAVEYSNETVGVDRKPAFENFPEFFDRTGADAQFIWSSNLILDNLVLLRRTLD